MKKFFKTLLVALLLIPSCTWANGWNNAEYQRNERQCQIRIEGGRNQGTLEDGIPRILLPRIRIGKVSATTKVFQA